MPNPNTLFDPTLMASVFPDAANMLPEDPHTAPYDALATRFAERQARLGIAAQAGVSVETAGIVADLLTTAPDGSSLDALERVEGKELVDQYKTAFEASEYLFGLVGEKIPSLEDPRLTEALKRLKPTFEVLKSMNLEPEIVIYPRHRSLDWWKQVGAKLQADPTINKDGRIKNGGLYVYDTIANNWDSFTNPNRQPVEWTLQVSSATEAPFITSVTSYGYTDSDNTAPEGKVNLLAQKLNLPTVQHRKKKDPVSSLQQPDLHPEI